MKPSAGHGNLLVLSLLALIVGVVSGFVGAVFRLALAAADRFRSSAIIWGHDGKLVGFLLILGGCAAAVALAAWLVRRFSPYASGSGIPQVEAILKDELPPPPPRSLLVKFFGGLLAMARGWHWVAKARACRWAHAIAHAVGRLSGAIGSTARC
jgi:CIC family chloride channel protein